MCATPMYQERSGFWQRTPVLAGSIHNPTFSGFYGTWPKPQGQRELQSSNDTWCSDDNELVEEKKLLNMQSSPRIVRHKALSKSNFQRHPLVSTQKNTEKAETYILRNRVNELINSLLIIENKLILPVKTLTSIKKPVADEEGCLKDVCAYQLV